MSKIEVDTIDTQSSTTLQVGSTNTSLIKIGTSGDTVEYPAGTTFTQSGTQNVTSGGAINVKSGGSIIIDSGAAITNNGTATGFSADLTNLNATNLTSGTVPDARFPATLPAANGSALTNLNATALTSGTIPTARITALPAGVGGKILQVVSTTISSQVAIASTSYTDTGITLAITPSATSSKILVMVFIQYTAYADNNGEIKSNARIMRDSTGVFESVSVLGSQVGTGNSGYQQTWGTLPLSYLDSPSSISAITYKVTAKNSTTSGNRQLKINHDSLGTSTITLMEVSA